MCYPGGEWLPRAQGAGRFDNGGRLVGRVTSAYGLSPGSAHLPSELGQLQGDGPRHNSFCLRPDSGAPLRAEGSTTPANAAGVVLLTGVEPSLPCRGAPPSHSACRLAAIFSNIAGVTSTPVNEHVVCGK